MIQTGTQFRSKHIYVSGRRIAVWRSNLASGAKLDKIDEIIDRAVDYTELVLANTPDYAPAAIAGLYRLRDTLTLALPKHPALQRLSDKIIEFEQRSNPRAIN